MSSAPDRASVQVPEEPLRCGSSDEKREKRVSSSSGSWTFVMMRTSWSMETGTASIIRGILLTSKPQSW